MKTFTKIAFLLICVCGINTGYAQCTPDTAMAKGSILPEALSYGYLGTAYSEVIYFRAPEDTTTTTSLGTFPVKVDSMEITGVKGLPGGFTYLCNTGNCLIKGGESGCVTVTGTPAQNGVYPLVVYIRTYATVKSFVDVPVTQNDSNTKYTLYAYGSVGLQNHLLETQVSIYPNPASSKVNITNGSGEEIRAELSDLTGRLLVSQQIGQEGTIDVTAFHQGVYFLRLVSRGEILTRKIVIE